MILIASDSTREAVLLSTLCELRNWPCQAISTLNELQTALEKTEPAVVVVRNRLREGYSDDVFVLLKKRPATISPRVVVLMPADSSIRAEARQIALGADCVLRDPVRVEVLFEYLAKYRAAPATSKTREEPSRSYTIAGAEIFPLEHRIASRTLSVHVAPQEIALLRLFSRSSEKVLTYPTLYEELFGRRFGGDTTNCRVLLVKVVCSFRRLGIDFRKFIQVIPKSGYLYSPTAKGASRNPDRRSPPRFRPRLKKAKSSRIRNRASIVSSLTN